MRQEVPRRESALQPVSKTLERMASSHRQRRRDAAGGGAAINRCRGASLPAHFHKQSEVQILMTPLRDGPGNTVPLLAQHHLCVMSSVSLAGSSRPRISSLRPGRSLLAPLGLLHVSHRALSRPLLAAGASLGVRDVGTLAVD